MHLLESYSGLSLQKIDKPWILEKYYPLPFDDYIILQPQGSCQSKSYSYWQSVIDIIFPELQKKGIHIVEVGDKNTVPYNRCFNIANKTSINQLAWLIRHAKAFLGADSIGLHFAAAMDIPLCILMGNTKSSISGGYWKGKSKRIYLDGYLKGELPSYSYYENPKSIDRLLPEKIAESTLSLLDIPFEYPYRTLFIGEFFHRRTLEMVLTETINPKSVQTENFIIRYDYLADEQNLVHQLHLCPCIIITNKPINPQILQTFKERIIEIVYFVEKINHPKFVKLVNNLGINFQLATFLSEEELNKVKLNYLDIEKPINIVDSSRPEKLKDRNMSELYYETNKFLLADRKIYTGKSSWIKKQNIPNIDNNILPAEDTQHFWEDVKFIRIMEKV